MPGISACIYQLFVEIVSDIPKCIYYVSVLLAWSSIIVAAKTPKWPDCYSVKAVLRLPYAELEEPITAYYEMAKNRSRIDYYG